MDVKITSVEKISTSRGGALRLACVYNSASLFYAGGGLVTLDRVAVESDGEYETHEGSQALMTQNSSYFSVLLDAKYESIVKPQMVLDFVPANIWATLGKDSNGNQRAYVNMSGRFPLLDTLLMVGVQGESSSTQTEEKTSTKKIVPKKKSESSSPSTPPSLEEDDDNIPF